MCSAAGILPVIASGGAMLSGKREEFGSGNENLGLIFLFGSGRIEIEEIMEF